MVAFTDGVIEEIERHLALVAPERGAALLGFGDLVTVAVLDSYGDYTTVSWDISRELGEAVAGLEAAGVGTLIGTVHSHPDGVPNPSSTDLESMEKTLRLNPHLERLVIAVVTKGRPARPEQLPIGRGHRMSVHVIRLVDDRRVVEPVTARELPVTGPLSDAGFDRPSSVSVKEWRRDAGRAGAQLPRVGRIHDQDRLFVPLAGNLLLAIPDDYPFAGPLLIEVTADGHEVLSAPWDPSRSPKRQLRTLARRAAARAVPGAQDRTAPLLGDLRTRRVVVAGLGSVGSRIAEDLVRAGVGTLVLIDPERVESPNLARSVYSSDDLGERKTRALARRLRAIAPAVHLVEHAATLGRLPLAEVLDGADLVVGATDDMQEQLLLAHHAYALGTPMVCCSMYAGARAGELIIALPEAASPCVACSLGDGRTINRFRPSSDYGMKGRLVAEPGLGTSIQLVASMAGMLALGVLAGPGSSLAATIAASVATSRTLAVIATHPDWDFFPQLFEGLGHQLAPQSVWLSVERNPDCVVCGPPDGRVPAPDHRFGMALAELIAGERD